MTKYRSSKRGTGLWVLPLILFLGVILYSLLLLPNSAGALNRDAIGKTIERDRNLAVAIGKLNTKLVLKNCGIIKQTAPYVRENIPENAPYERQFVHATNTILAEMNRSGVTDALVGLAPTILRDFSFSKTKWFKQEELRIAREYGMTSQEFDEIAQLADNNKDRFIKMAEAKAFGAKFMMLAIGGGSGLGCSAGANAALLANWDNEDTMGRIMAIFSLLMAALILLL